MNYLSTKLSKALTNPSFSNQRKSSSLTPSSASVRLSNKTVVGACSRQQFYKIKGFEPDNKAKNIDWTLSAIMGDKMHELLVDMLDTYGFEMGLQKLTKEHSIYDSLLNLSGRCDLIVWDHNNKEPIGIEIKSIGEFKAKKAVEQPVEEHLLQAVVYLDYYNRNIPDNQTKITKWYLWYLSRTENWTVKGKAHNSPFTMLWDFCIELDNGVPIVTLTDGTKQKWTDYSIQNIYDRYNHLSKALSTNTLPDRDYEILYSEEKITELYKLDKIPTKTNTEIVKKWLDKGAPPGKLKLSMGDSECMFCEFSALCWEGTQNKAVKTISNLPSSVPETKRTKNTPFLL
jgi:hypothetical protein